MDAVDEELHACTSDANLVRNLGQVVGDKTIARPLGKEGHGDDDVHTLAVSRHGEE